jgi:thiol-disulfide isomerase/thioredoxin
MDFVDKGINYIKKLCQDDEVCVMLVFVLVGFMVCYLFKNQISGFTEFKSVEHEFDSGAPSVLKGTPVDHPPMKMPPKVPPKVPPEMPPKMPEMDKKPVGIELKPRKPDPTASTKRQLGVMAAKPPVKRAGVQQVAELQIQDASIFKPFDEVWNPGFMPLDMVFKGVPSKMAADRPMPPTQAPPPQAPPPQAPPPQAPPPQAPPQGAEEVNLVLVYAPWCGYSKKMLPDYEKIKAEFDGKTINGKKINIIMYNSEDDKDKDKIKEYDVKGFPTLFFESNGKRETFPHREYDKIKSFLESL